MKTAMEVERGVELWMYFEGRDTNRIGWKQKFS
jgi:hypothetical protein